MIYHIHVMYVHYCTGYMKGQLITEQELIHYSHVCFADVTSTTSYGIYLLPVYTYNINLAARLCLGL